MLAEIRICDACVDEGKLVIAVAEVQKAPGKTTDVGQRHLQLARRMELSYTFFENGPGDVEWPPEEVEKGGPK